MQFKVLARRITRSEIFFIVLIVYIVFFIVLIIQSLCDFLIIFCFYDFLNLIKKSEKENIRYINSKVTHLFIIQKKLFALAIFMFCMQSQYDFFNNFISFTKKKMFDRIYKFENYITFIIQRSHLHCQFLRFI